MACGGAINAGSYGATHWRARGIPPLAESERVRRDLELATGAGKTVHIAHISTRESIEMVHRGARSRR